MTRRVLVINTDPQLGRAIGEALAAKSCSFELAAGDADALRRLRRTSFDALVTSPLTNIEEDLALVEEVRDTRPGVKVIILAPQSSPEDVIAALRARVFVCFSAPFDAGEISESAYRAATAEDWQGDIEVISAHKEWVSLRVNCRLLTAERLVQFLGELRSEMPDVAHQELMFAFHEIIMNSMEHGAGFDPEHVVEVAAVRTSRATVFYVRDPGEGFRRDAIPHAAVSNPAGEPTAHMQLRAEQGIRPGGYGILLARSLVDELIFSEIGNEVLLIKHTA